jgi:DNA-binding IclR family transcriptional regulator
MRGTDRLNIDVVLGTHELKAVPEVGGTRPIYAGAAGKALLAFLSDGEAKQVIGDSRIPKVARNTVESGRALYASLKAIRDRGYARSAEETVNGQGAIAAPILVNGSLVGVVNVSIPLVRLSEKFGQEAVPLVMKTARVISRAMAQARPRNSQSIMVAGSRRAPSKRVSAHA